MTDNTFTKLANIPKSAPHYFVLAEVVRRLGAVSYLEIGVQEGGSLFHVLKANPQIDRIALCDSWGNTHGGTGRGTHEHIAVMLKELEYDKKVTWLDGPSSALIPEIADDRFEVVHVDGDHSEVGAYADFVRVWPLVSKAMVVHDTDWNLLPSVRDALSRWSTDFSGTYSQIHHFSYDKGTTVVVR